MTMPSATKLIKGNSSKPLKISLWAAQLLLAIIFGMAGVVKTFLSPDAAVAIGVNYATVLPFWLLRFIGISELSGAIGLILPAVTRIRPGLTPLAAFGLAIIQVLAMGFHAMRGEMLQVLPFNLVLLGLSLFVLWGRWKKAPIAPRS